MLSDAQTAIDAAERHLRTGQQAFAATLRVLDDPEVVPEDRPLDSCLTAQALEHFRAAAAGFAQGGSPRQEAHALLGAAEVLMRAPGTQSERIAAVMRAEQCTREAIERFDAAAEPAPAARALLLHVEAGHQLVGGVAPEQREARLRRLSALLDAAAYLAAEMGAQVAVEGTTDMAAQAGQLDDPLLAARIAARSTQVLAERFKPGRDENLLDAIRCGERAIRRMRAVPAAHGFELPLLLYELGNCAMKVAGERSHWLRQGRDWYREGAAAVDARRYPRLHRVLAEHVLMAESLLQQGDHALPEKEMVARYALGIQTALEKEDAAEARSLAWGFLAWGWSLQHAPNVHVGEAHKALAKVALSSKQWEEAQSHLYHSVGVLSALLSERDPWYYLLEQARELLAQVLRHNGQDRDTWLGLAAESLVSADAACRRGANLINDDPGAALPHFEQALNVFPCHPTARFYRAVVRLMAQDWAGAAADLDMSLTLRPKNLPARVNRAAARRALGDLDGALADLNEAVELDPRNVGVRRTRAGLHEQRGERDKAIADLEAAVKEAGEGEVRAQVEGDLARLRAG
jgi:tetratricopeptide (TPR) repeat protein